MIDDLGPQDKRELDRLLRVLESRPVIALAGAGVSVPLGYPTWQELIYHLLDHLQAVSRISTPGDARLAAQAGKAHLPEVASWVKGQISEAEYHTLLHDLFTPRAGIDCSYELECLARLPVRLWLTTNYDLCLSEALSARLTRNVATTTDLALDQVTTGSETLPRVVHLHGKIDEPATIVLTSDDYDAIYLRNRKLGHAVTGLQSTTLLFVGYGLRDEELNTCLRTTRQVLGPATAEHFALLPRSVSQTDFELEMEARRLSRLGVRPIFYPTTEGDHRGRLQIVSDILEALQLSPPSPRVETSFGWIADDMSPARLRARLHTLAGDAHLAGDVLMLRRLSFTDRTLTLAASSQEAKRRVEDVVRVSREWTLEPLPRRAEPEGRNEAVRLARRDGTPFIAPSLALGQTAIVSREELERAAAASPHQGADLTASEQHTIVAHAKALGLLRRAAVPSRPLEKALMPPPLVFGLSDALDPDPIWRLDSPIIHVWFYTAEPEPSETSPVEGKPLVGLTAIGTGLPWIRERVETAVYMLALAMPELQEGLVFTRGVIHLSLQESPRDESQGAGAFARLLGRVVSGGRQTPTPQVPDDAATALENLRSTLIQLAQDTGFLEIHETPYERLVHYTGELRAELARAREGRPVVREPRPDSGFVTCFPITGFPYLTNPKISLRLSGDVLDSPEFKTLIEAYHLEVILRMRADAERRLEFWRNELDRDRMQIAWFKGLSEAEQDAQPDVKTGRQILEDLGIDIAVEEKLVSARVYFLDNLPRVHVPREERQVARFRALCASIARAVAAPHSTIWRRCVARIFDCALRGVPLTDDPRSAKLFDEWRDIADGMLRVEWPRTLATFGLDSVDIFRRNTIFDVDYDAGANLLAVYPVAIIDPSRAVVLIDRARGSLVVHDILDEAVNELVDGTSAAGSESLDLSVVSGAEANEELRRRVATEPRVAAYLCDEARRPIVQEFAAEKLSANARTAAAACSAGRRFFWWFNLGAYHSATEALEPEDATNSPATKLLAIAFLRCLRRHLEPFDTFRRFVRRAANIPSAVAGPLGRAEELDPGIVERFLRDRTIGSDALPPSTPAAAFAVVLERVREATALSTLFHSVASDLDIRGETQSTAFMKTARAFEAAYGAIASHVMPALPRIQRVLTGQPETDRPSRDE